MASSISRVFATRLAIRLISVIVFAFPAVRCAVPGAYYGGGFYNAGANYAQSCNYYTPPWGYPPDYCQYQVWNEPIYYGGIWFSGPIYYRRYLGENWFWLRGGWRRDEWHGPRPNIDWSRNGNQRWHGEIHRGRGALRENGRTESERQPNGVERTNPSFETGPRTSGDTQPSVSSPRPQRRERGSTSGRPVASPPDTGQGAQRSDVGGGTNFPSRGSERNIRAPSANDETGSPSSGGRSDAQGLAAGSGRNVPPSPTRSGTHRNTRRGASGSPSNRATRKTPQPTGGSDQQASPDPTPPDGN